MFQGESNRTLRRKASRFIRHRGGANAVEFAIIAPLLLLIVVGILVYGIYFGTAHAVQQLAADAARASVAGLSDSERRTIALNHITTSAGNYLLLRPEKLTARAEPSPEDGDLFVVAIDYDASDLPVFGLDALVPVPDSTIRRSAAIRRGGF